MKTVIIGLGSNIGDRLSHLRQAFQAIRQMPSVFIRQVSPVYYSEAMLPDNAPDHWNKPYLNLALRCETAIDTLILFEQLKKIELKYGYKPEVRHWGPRIIDIDLLACEDLILQTDSLTLPHPGLLERPFALWPLADVAPLWPFPTPGETHLKTAAEHVEKWGSRFTGDSPFQTRQLLQRIDTPQFVGIVNVTPDSFSDGGDYLSPHQALHHILSLVQSGAEVIDIGAESTAPQASLLDPETEWNRLEPVLSALQAVRKNLLVMPKISIDTRHATVAEKALAMMEIDWINDVTGLSDPAMRALVRQSGIDCVMMHHLSMPASRHNVLPRDQDNIRLVYQWAKAHLQTLEEEGINPANIIFDPGIGFGKTAEQSLMLLRHVAEFKSLGTRILVGHSRKSFLSLFSSKPAADRDIDTLAIALYLATQAVDYIRVHDVAMCAQAIKVTSALC